MSDTPWIHVHIHVAVGADVLLALHGLTDALLALATSYQRGGEVETPKAARAGTTSPLQPTGEDAAQAHRSPAPVEPVSPPSPRGLAPAAQAGSGGDPGVLDVSSLQLSSAERGKKPAPPKAFLNSPHKGWLNDARRPVLARLYGDGTSIGDIRAALEAIPGPSLPPNKQISAYATTGLLIRRPPGFQWRATPEPAPAGRPVTISQTLDDAPSVAACQLRDDQQHLGVAFVSWDVVLHWAKYEKIMRGTNETEFLARVNDARRKYDLPPFRIIASRSLRPAPLPAPHIGAGNKNNHSKSQQ